jgi:hypothetical protein
MELEDILEAVRGHYLTAYREAIASYRQRFSPGGPEVLLEISRETPEAYRYYRMDLASGAVEPPDFTEVNPGTHLEFTPVAFKRLGLVISVSPLVWNGVEVRVEPPLSNDASLQSWALRWLDLEERAQAGSDGLGAYLHSITVPASDGNATTFSIDFGSAPTASLLELLGLLREAGATSVELHSRTVLAS